MKLKNLLMSCKNIFYKGETNDRSNQSTMLIDIMHTVDMVELIGIESNEIYEVLKSQKMTETAKTKIVVNKLDFCPDEEFKKRLISKLMFFENYGYLTIEDNVIEGIYETIDKDNTYYLKIEILDKNISFDLSDIKVKLECRGKLKFKENNSYIVSYHDLKTKKTDLLDESIYEEVIAKKKILVFDNDGVQTFEYECEQMDNYLEVEGIKHLTEPSCFENYIKKIYKWRTYNNKIIKRVIQKYILDGDFNKNYDHYLIGENVIPYENKLPFGGHFYGFDKNKFNEYMYGNEKGAKVKKITHHV